MNSRIAAGAVFLLAAQAFLFFSMPAGRSFLPVAFLSIPLLGFAAFLIYPQGAESARVRFHASLALAFAAVPFLLLSAPGFGASFPAILGFCVLAAICVFFVLSLAAAIHAHWPERGMEFPILMTLITLSIVPSWFGWGISLSPLSALSNLFQVDWIRDGELYFRVPSESPLEYPDWRWYALSLLLAGAAFSFLANTWRRR